MGNLPTNFSDASTMAGNHAAAHDATNTALNNMHVYNVLDYGTVGSNADEVAINAAISAANAAGGGIVLIPAGTYFITSTITPLSKVHVVGAGKQRTIIRFYSAATTTNLVTSGSSTLSNFSIEHVTLDAQDKTNAGIINCSTTIQGFVARDCEFLNMNCTTASHWALRVGSINDLDVAGSASYNVSFYNNLFSNNNCHTFEVVLLPNVRESWGHHNKFIDNSTTGTSEVSWYSDNYNCRYSENIHIDWSDRAVHVAEADQVDIINNHFTNSSAASPIAIHLNNLVNCKISNNNITMPASNTGYGIFHQDNNVGRDGHAQVNPNSYNVDISGNTFTNCYYGIANTQSTSSNHQYQYFSIANNKFYNCLKSPIRFGPNTTGLTIDIQHLHVLDNIIYSWSGNIEGAISFYGDSTAPTNIKKIYIKRNHIANNTTGATSGAIRLSAAQAEVVEGNYATSSGSYGALSLPSSGSVNYCSNNVGLNPLFLYAQGNVTGATTFNRANGQQITATLTGNITVTLTAGQIPGDELVLELTQDATGSRTVTWPANFKKAGGSLTLSTAAGAVDVIKAAWDGTNWVEVSRALNVS